MILESLSSLSDCRQVVDLQVATWGRDSEIVPASVLHVSAKRGGILIGARDKGNIVGFVWSMPGWRDGQPTHWSHMLAVAPAARGSGLGEQLKRAQRDAARAQGVGLIEWTFDPLQALNAHLNMNRLGAIATSYLVNAYGDMSGLLHRGTPTDRLVAEWWIDTPHVERRLEPRGLLQARSAEAASAPLAIETAVEAGWHECASTDLTIEDQRLRVPVPPRFTEMQQTVPDVAIAWRLATRAVFTTYFWKGYRAVDFLAGADGGGAYLLAKPE